MSVYQTLSKDKVNKLNHLEAEAFLASILSERATISGNGKILRFSEFNENPDPLVDELLARILVGKMNKEWFAGLVWDQIAVVSIESSAAYLAGAIAYEVADLFNLERPPRIIRARKLPKGEVPSPALGNRKVVTKVRPITAGGEVRHLMASKPSEDDFFRVEVAIVVDDFKATGSTLAGGITLTREMLQPSFIIPVAALGKPDQETVFTTNSNDVNTPMTALDVKFWGDSSGKAFIQANNQDPLIMSRASSEDFGEH